MKVPDSLADLLDQLKIARILTARLDAEFDAACAEHLAQTWIAQFADKPVALAVVFRRAEGFSPELYNALDLVCRNSTKVTPGSLAPILARSPEIFSRRRTSTAPARWTCLGAINPKSGTTDAVGTLSARSVDENETEKC